MGCCAVFNGAIYAQVSSGRRHSGRDCRKPEHMDVKVRKYLVPLNTRKVRKLPSMALDTGIPASMTTLGQLCV